MKKRLIVCLSIVSFCLVICLFVVSFQIKKQKTDNSQMDYPKESAIEQEKNKKSEVLKDEDAEEVRNEASSGLIEKNGQILEILDFEYVDKLEDYVDYEEEYIWYEDKPELGTDIRMEKEIDFEAVYEAAPEYEDSEKNPEKYTIEEQYKILEETQDIIDKNTKEVEVSYDYLFIRCRLTNTSNKGTEVAINSQELAVVKDGKWDYRYDHTLLPIYFDKVQKDKTDTSFFFYNMELKETLEYTVAFAIKENDAEGVYYYGIPDVITDGNGIPQNPTEQTMYMRSLFQR